MYQDSYPTLQTVAVSAEPAETPRSGVLCWAVASARVAHDTPTDLDLGMGLYLAVHTVWAKREKGEGPGVEASS